MSARRGRDRGQGNTTVNGQYPATTETFFLYQSPLIRFQILLIASWQQQGKFQCDGGPTNRCRKSLLRIFIGFLLAFRSKLYCI